MHNQVIWKLKNLLLLGVRLQNTDCNDFSSIFSSIVVCEVSNSRELHDDPLSCCEVTQFDPRHSTQNDLELYKMATILRCIESILAVCFLFSSFRRRVFENEF